MKSAGNAVISILPMHRSYGLQGPLKRRYKHPFLTSINGYHTAKNGLGAIVYKWPTFAFTPESGYTLAFANRIAHKRLHGETGGVSDGGAITTLGAFHTFRKPCVARCQNGKLCRFWALVGGALLKNAESLRDSDALMRVAVPRCRGPAGLRNSVITLLML